MSPNRWLILGVLFVARTAMAYQFLSVAAVAPFVIEDLAIGYAALGALVGLYMLPGVVIALPGGMLGRRFGEKQVTGVGLLLMAAGGALMGVADDYGLTVAGRLMSGVGAVLLNVMLTKMAADWFAGREIVTAMAILLNSWPFGMALALVTQAAIAEAAGWHAVMLVGAAAAAGSLVLLWLTYRPPPAGPRPSHPPPAGPRAAPGRLALDFGRRELALVLLAGAIWSLYNVGYILLQSFGPDFLVAGGRSAADAGSLVSLASWIMLASIPLGGYAAERLGREGAFLTICLAVTAVAFGLFAVWDAPVVLLVAVGVFFGPAAGIIMAMPAAAVRPEVLAPASGLFFTCYYAGMAALPPLAGFARDASGAPSAPMLIAAALLFICLPLYGLFRLIGAGAGHGGRYPTGSRRS